MSSIIEKIDKLLDDDSNFTTRTGLRFMTVVLKEAIQVIQTETAATQSANTRLTNVENGLTNFLEIQAKKDKKAEEERSKWRWAILAPIITIAISELVRLFR